MIRSAHTSKLNGARFFVLPGIDYDNAVISQVGHGEGLEQLPFSKRII